MGAFLFVAALGVAFVLLLAYAIQVVVFAQGLQFRLPWGRWFAAEEIEAPGIKLFLALHILQDAGILEARLRDAKETLLDQARANGDGLAEEELSKERPSILLASRYYEFCLRRGRPRKDQRQSFFQAEPVWQPILA